MKDTILIILILISFLAMAFIMIWINKTSKEMEVKHSYDKLKDLLSLKDSISIKDFKLPNTKIKVDLAIIHTTGIYIIKRIDLSGYIFATEHINYWDIKNNGVTERIYNPCGNIDKIAEMIEQRTNIKTIPAVILNNNCSGYIIDKGFAMGIRIAREQDQLNIIDDTEEIIIQPENLELVKNKMLTQIAAY